MQLILASTSPRRAELLRAAGYAFEIHPVDIDESVRPGEQPDMYVVRLANEKAARAREEITNPAEAGSHAESVVQADAAPLHADVASGFSRTDDLIVLGADTAVVVDNEILGKPLNVDDAARMLRRLSGRMHQVMTGISLQSAVAAISHVEISNVFFAALTQDDMEWYVASGEGRDKAGAYAIQGLASRFIPRIEGSYSNIVGLPIAAVKDLIVRLPTARSLLASGE